MIKKSLIIGACIFSGIIMAQTEDTTNSIRKNDVMIDPIMTSIGLLNVSYERHLNQHLGVGISTMYKFSDYATKELLWDTSILSYIRYYYGNGNRRGFFLEGFTGVVIDNFTQTTHYTYENPPRVVEGDRIHLTGFALGAGLGGKWNTKSNILFEVSVGAGYQSTYEILPIFFRGMLGIGYRF